MKQRDAPLHFRAAGADANGHLARDPLTRRPSFEHSEDAIAGRHGRDGPGLVEFDGSGKYWSRFGGQFRSTLSVYGVDVPLSLRMTMMMESPMTSLFES